MNRRIQAAFVAVSIFAVAYALFVNRATPFRAEHWALLYAYLKAPTSWQAVDTVSNFVCFGVKRFQPLAFFPTVASYLAFGNDFGLHYVWGALLQAGLTFGFILLLHALRHRQSPPTKLNVSDYWLEAALFFVLFPSSDVVLWSFFHYIQIAAILGCLAFWLFFEIRRKALAYSLVFIAVLIYEPFLALVALFTVCDIFEALKNKRATLSLLLPLAFLAFVLPQYYEKYSRYFGDIARFNEMQRQMVETSLPVKVAFCFYKLALALLATISTTFWPALATRHNIYELPIPTWLRSSTFEYQTFTYVKDGVLPTVTLFLLAGITFLMTVLVNRQKQQSLRFFLPYALLLCAWAGPFLIIAWGRPVYRDIAISFQFRYILVGLPFLFAVLLDSARLLINRTTYSLLLGALIIINSFSYMRHGYFVEKDLADLSRYVASRESRGLATDEVVEATMNVLADGKLPIQNWNDAFFLYNAQKCLIEWQARSKSPVSVSSN